MYYVWEYKERMKVPTYHGSAQDFSGCVKWRKALCTFLLKNHSLVPPLSSWAYKADMLTSFEMYCTRLSISATLPIHKVKCSFSLSTNIRHTLLLLCPLHFIYIRVNVGTPDVNMSAWGYKGKMEKRLRRGFCLHANGSGCMTTITYTNRGYLLSLLVHIYRETGWRNNHISPISACTFVQRAMEK